MQKNIKGGEGYKGEGSKDNRVTNASNAKAHTLRVTLMGAETFSEGCL